MVIVIEGCDNNLLVVAMWSQLFGSSLCVFAYINLTLAFFDSAIVVMSAMWPIEAVIIDIKPQRRLHCCVCVAFYTVYCDIFTFLGHFV